MRGHIALAVREGLERKLLPLYSCLNVCMTINNTTDFVPFRRKHQRNSQKKYFMAFCHSCQKFASLCTYIGS